MSSNWKERLNVVYSTNPEFQYEKEEAEEQETLPSNQQNLIVCLDKKNRKGKAVTLVKNFIGSNDDLKELSKMLKSKCGVGGSEKNNEILIQGDFRDKVYKILMDTGYKVKVSGK